MWPQMPTPLSLPSTPVKTTTDLSNISTTALMGAPTRPLTPLVEAHEDSAPALKSLATLMDVMMPYLSIKPTSLDLNPQSLPQREDPEGDKQPPPYCDSNQMAIEDSSSMQLLQSPLGSHTEIETNPHDTEFTQANDPHQGTECTGTRKRPLPSPASPGLSTNAVVDESMAPPSKKRSRIAARNPTSRRFNYSRPQVSHSQDTSFGKKAVKARMHGTGVLLKASAFDDMKEVVMRDLTKEYVRTVIITSTECFSN